MRLYLPSGFGWMERIRAIFGGDTEEKYGEGTTLWKCKKVGEIWERNYNHSMGWFLSIFLAWRLTGGATIHPAIPGNLQISPQQEGSDTGLLAQREWDMTLGYSTEDKFTRLRSQYLCGHVWKVSTSNNSLWGGRHEWVGKGERR